MVVAKVASRFPTPTFLDTYRNAAEPALYVFFLSLLLNVPDKFGG